MIKIDASSASFWAVANKSEGDTTGLGLLGAAAGEGLAAACIRGNRQGGRVTSVCMPQPRG